MQTPSTRRLLAVLTIFAASHLASAQQTASLPKAASPESVGFSAERLDRLHAQMQKQVDDHQLAGVVTLLARHGKVVEAKAYGKTDLVAGTPMTTDSIFRIFSMTKPVTGGAMMILYEEGKWSPSDPIAKFIPEFAHLKVYAGMDKDGKMLLEDPKHPPTIGELLTHTAGFTYGVFGATPVDKIYADQHILGSDNLQQMIDKLAKTPLLYQPGTKWVYSVSMDIQGYLVEKISGQSLPDFMQQHIFGPLKMNDTGFFVPQEKRARVASLYVGDADGKLVPSKSEGNSPATNYSAKPGLASGGGGLVSTAEDYLRFAQMLLNQGELDGVRILAPGTVQLMTANHLAPSLMTGEFSIGTNAMKLGEGWGYDCAVITDPMQAGESVGKGTYFWNGAAATWFWIDPTNDLIFIGMTQRMFGNGQPDTEHLSRPVVYGALVDPKK